MGLPIVVSRRLLHVRLQPTDDGAKVLLASLSTGHARRLCHKPRRAERELTAKGGAEVQSECRRDRHRDFADYKACVGHRSPRF